MQILTRTTHALYSIGTDGVKTRGYILLARGQPNWYYGKLVGGGGHVNGTRPSDHVWRVGNLSYTVSYDPERNSATLLGTTIWLDTANVLMLDRVDQIGGEAQLLKTACVHEFDENDPARSYLNDSTIQAFIRSRPLP